MNAAGNQVANRHACSPSIVVSCAVLLLAMLLATSFAALWGASRFGTAGLSAALIAGGIITIAALAALLVSAGWSSSEHALAANLGAMGLRFGAPLFALVFVPQVAPWLLDAGFGVSLLGCYFVALVSETLLAVRHVKPSAHSVKTALISVGETHSR